MEYICLIHCFSVKACSDPLARLKLPPLEAKHLFLNVRQYPKMQSTLPLIEAVGRSVPVTKQQIQSKYVFPRLGHSVDLSHNARIRYLQICFALRGDQSPADICRCPWPRLWTNAVTVHSATNELALRQMNVSLTMHSMQSWTSEEGQGGTCPPRFWRFSAKKGFLNFESFEWEKTNLTTFASLRKFLENSLVAPWKKSFRRPCMRCEQNYLYKKGFATNFQTCFFARRKSGFKVQFCLSSIRLSAYMRLESSSGRAARTVAFESFWAFLLKNYLRLFFPSGKIVPVLVEFRWKSLRVEFLNQPISLH